MAGSDFLRIIEEYIISLDPPAPPTPSLRPIELQPIEPSPMGLGLA